MFVLPATMHHIIFCVMLMVAIVHCEIFSDPAINVQSPRFSSFQDEPIRLLFIGDSIDRLMVEDFCTAINGALYKESTLSPSRIVHDAFKTFGRKRKSWEIRLCEHQAENLRITFLANKFGVKPQAPWHSPIATMSGMEDRLLDITSSFSVKTLFDFALAPALEPLSFVAGGEPHGVIISSVFWDLSHPDPHGTRTFNRSAWIQSWAQNVSQLLESVKVHHPQTKWFAWHSAPSFRSTETEGHWNTKYALQLLFDANLVSKYVAESQGFEFVDFISAVFSKLIATSNTAAGRGANNNSTSIVLSPTARASMDNNYRLHQNIRNIRSLQYDNSITAGLKQHSIAPLIGRRDDLHPKPAVLTQLCSYIIYRYIMRSPSSPKAIS